MGAELVMYKNSKPITAQLSKIQRHVLDFINAGVSDLNSIIELCSELEITPDETYWAASFLRRRGLVKGRKAMNAKNEKLIWTYHPLTAQILAERASTYEQQKAKADAILARWKSGSTPVETPAPKDTEPLSGDVDAQEVLRCMDHPKTLDQIMQTCSLSREDAENAIHTLIAEGDMRKKAFTDGTVIYSLVPGRTV